MISVIMPAYNSKEYLREAVSSVLMQTVSDLELLIIDDASTDGTSEICNSLSKTDERIRVFHNEENLGVSRSRNLGVQNARGEWIAYLDSDDVWEKSKLELQLTLAEKEKAVFLFTGSAFMDENGRMLDYYLPAPKCTSYPEILKQNVISCSSVLIRKELMLQYPMYDDNSIHEDFLTWAQILKNEKISAYGVDKPLLIYRISSSSKSGNKIKAGMMTFSVYRRLGLSLIPALYYWFCYLVRSLHKYRHLAV